MCNTQTGGGTGKVGKKTKTGISPNRTTLPNIYCSLIGRARLGGIDKRTCNSRARKS